MASSWLSNESRKAGIMGNIGALDVLSLKGDMFEKDLFKFVFIFGGTGEQAGEGCAEDEHSDIKDDGAGDAVYTES